MICDAEAEKLLSMLPDEFKIPVGESSIANDVLRLGLACNENCLFCNVPPECNEISGEEYVRKKILGTAPGRRVALSGGEPSLYHFLPDLIRLAASRGVRTELQTNAIMLADFSYAKKLSDSGLGQAFVSLHSHIEAVHDFLTGLKGSWKKGICGIKNLQKLGVPVIVNTVLTSVNSLFLPDFIVFLSRRMNVRLLSLSVVQPRKRALKNKTLVPDYSILDKSVREALSVAKKENVWVGNPICGLPFCIGGWENCPEHSMEYVQGMLGDPFIKGKIKPTCCGKCTASPYCGGVWEEYNIIRGSSALKPFGKSEMGVDFYGR